MTTPIARGPVDVNVRDRPLQEQLRDCVAKTFSITDPYWIDTAKRLMLWAANSLDAAEIAIRDNYEKHGGDEL